MTNPWNLTPRECEAMAALAAEGCSKAAARRMGVARQTVAAFLLRAKERMGESQWVVAVVKFDRWHQAALLKVVQEALPL